ncbi:hypothetical protein EDD99_7157 [Streptomyces sp. 846.5]|nr:hypothetical protein [Streptomyces sp. 846.5]TDT95332.1 hypothetical protein EDD99_7157 [Streptomyces sp. 846.5]
MTDTTRPTLNAAIGAYAAAVADPRQGDIDAFEAGIKADAALFGGPAWDALPPMRRQLVQHRALTGARAAGGAQ